MGAGKPGIGEMWWREIVCKKKAGIRRILNDHVET